MASVNGISDRSPLASPRAEDEYGEIFRSFTRGLKVPPVPFLEFSTDFGGGIAEISGDSYSDIFGGFGWDVAVSLEELFGGLIAGAGKKDAEKKTRGNGERKSLEKVPSRLHSFSVEQKRYSSGNISMASTSASEQLHDEKPFPRSYKMTDSPGRENCMNKIHALELDSVSRYISDIDSNFCSLENHHSDIRDAVSYSTCTVSNVSEEVPEIKPKITVVHGSSSRSCLPHMHGNDWKQDSANVDTKSHHVEYAPSTCINSLSYPFHEHGIDEPDSSEAFLTVAEINLQTQPTQLPPPSRPPPKLDIKRDGKKHSSTSNWHHNHNLHNLANSNGGYYRMTSSETSIVEVALKPCLLPCLDVEMDANSAASASTAALKEVMDQTRTNTKIARESNEIRGDIRDNQKVLEARERERGIEQKKGEADQGFFTYTPKVAPGEMMHYEEENWQVKTNPSLEALDLHQGHRIFYPAHGYENSLKGSSMVVGFDWQKMKVSLDNGDQGEDQGMNRMMPAEENFVHEEGGMRPYLTHTYREKLLGEGFKGVKGMWEMEKREDKLGESERWHVKEKTPNPAVVTYERKESGNKLMTVQKIQQKEENIGKNITYELCKRAGQEIKQQGEKGKKKSPNQWQTRKEMQSFATAWGDNAEKEKELILNAVQEIGKQEQVQNSRQSLTKNVAEQEEAIRLRLDENTYWHEKGDKVFEVFQDVNEATNKTQNAAKVISKQETEYKKKGMAHQVMDENSRTIEQIRYFTEAHEREQKEKVQFDKGSLEMEADKEMDELWRLEEEMEKLWRLEEEVADGRGKGRDSVALETQNANDKVILEICSSVELAAVDREIAKVPERANAVTCKTTEDVQAESWKKSQEKASKGPMLGTVQATRYGALAEDWEQPPVNVIIREATAELTDFIKQGVVDMIASSIGDEQKRDGEPELCDETSLSMNTERHSPMSEVQNFSYDVSFELEIEKRQKARLERCKRTEDRMARALAELKAWDTLAEKEQTERNRLAEVLDCDIKRWSSGKEGNLRALLSTLQYILWPESGWNPIPLTEVITSAAVKKAYKKATLCLHPDKVQQKGASIQQKYISEKVFDLLKDAWDNFNSEER